MTVRSNKDLIAAIQNGDQEILFYLSRKYFQSARRLLRSKGIPDARTPDVFSEVLIEVCREIQQRMISPNIDFESYLFNALGESVLTEKSIRRENRIRVQPDFTTEQRDVVSRCLNIQDKQSRNILIARYSDSLSYEQIAARFEFSNPVIAQVETGKAFHQLEGIICLRLNIDPGQQEEGEEERLLIDRYLFGQLSGLELQQFMERLERNPSFRFRVSFQNLMIDGIQQASRQHQKDEIIKFIGYSKPRVPLSLKLIIIFLFITLSGIVLWNYIGTESSNSGKGYFTFSFFHRKNEETSGVVKPALKKPAKRDAGPTRQIGTPAKSDDTVPEEREESSTRISAENSIEPGATGADSLNRNPAGGQNFNFKKDQLLISLSLKVNIVGKRENEEAGTVSLTKGAIEKLNPGAGLESEEEKSQESFEVEFWISPVNYKGYKLMRNKIILFGIEEPDAVKLFRADNQLFLKYIDAFYKLSPTEDFSAYHRVRDTDLPVSIQQ